MASPSAEQFAQLRALFERVCEVPAAAQSALLAELCSSPQMRAEVTAMLAADATDAGWLDQDLAAKISPLLAQQPAMRISDYEVIKPIARGGMGDVYLARRCDAAFEQIVALKLTQSRLDEADMRRFVDEQRILAKLQHPGIAQLIDGGIDANVAAQGGQPYLVMEYVDGLSITEHCDHHSLTLEQRLALFLQVCTAVSYAHRNLIVHRDLKPSNILVTADGNAKLLDFGIAKILAADEDLSTATQTGLMTPAYAAPEQVLGQPITTGTDVYALGLLLYEMLSGQRAQPIEGLTPSEIERAICTDEAPPPSQPAAQSQTHREWARRIASDLDSVVAKALSKEPERRYASVQSLADDVANFLADRPVEARPQSTWYRAYRYVKRHRWQASAVALVALLTLATALTATLAAVRINRALEQIKVEVSKSEQIASFLRELFAATDPEENAGESLTIRQVLDRSAERLQTELRDDPANRSMLHTEIGRIYLNLGVHQPALENLQLAAELRRATPGIDPVDLAQTLLSLSAVEDGLGAFDDAESSAREALFIFERSLQPDDLLIAESIGRLGSVLAGKGETDQAELTLKRALAKFSAGVGEQDHRTQSVMHNLAWVYDQRGDFVAAERVYRRVLAASANRADTDHPDHLSTLENLGLALRQQGRLDEAEPYYRDVLARRTRRLGANHDAVGNTRFNLAALLYARGKLRDAEAMFIQAIANWRVSLGVEHANVGLGLSAVGRLQERLEEYDSAIDSLSQSLAILAMHRPATDPRYADAAVALGRILVNQGKAEAAQQWLSAALSIRQQSETTKRRALGEAEMELGHCLLLLGEHAQGSALLSAGIGKIQADSDANDSLRERAATLAKRAESSGNVD